VRSRQPALLALVLLLLASPLALAFKAGGDFAKPAAAGGGGAILFTGAPTYRRWTCAACHTGSAGRVRMRLESQPPELLTRRRYQPGATYALTVRLEGEHRGLDSALNTNGFAVTMATAAGEAAGRFTGVDGTELAVGNTDAELVSSGLYERRTTWAFVWEAPVSGTGDVTAYLAVVDGDGASRKDLRTSDPFNDDLAVGSIRLEEAAP
jgi:hypothetical protein